MSERTPVTRNAVAALAAALLALSALAAVRPARAADAPIQPGAIVYTPRGQCTLNFVFRDARGTRYIGTAGHCVRGVGDRVRDGSRVEFGTVVFSSNGRVHDYALIRIDAARHADVNPALRQWGGPTGVHDDRDAFLGDPVLQHGYGIVYGSNPATRGRAGVLWDIGQYDYVVEGAALFGDSGGPVLDQKTGRALGIANWINVPPWLMGGATIEGFMERAAGAGFALTIETAPYTFG